MAKIKLEKLKSFCKTALVKEGMKEEYAQMVAEVLSSEDICVSGACVTKPVFMCVSPAFVWLSPTPARV